MPEQTDFVERYRALRQRLDALAEADRTRAEVEQFTYDRYVQTETGRFFRPRSFEPAASMPLFIDSVEV